MNLKNGNSKPIQKNKNVLEHNKQFIKTTTINNKHKIVNNSFNNNDQSSQSYTINFQNGVNKNSNKSITGDHQKNNLKENKGVNKDKTSKENSQGMLSPNFTFGNKFSNLLYFRSNSHILDETTNNKNNNDSFKEFEENERKLKESIQIYSQNVRKNEGASVNTLFKIRTVLLNWLKDSEQDNLEYSKFMTEKKIKYLLKNKDKLESRIKLLENDLNNIKTRKSELESILGDIYLSYENEELEQEIERFYNSYEIRTGKGTKMMEKFEEMKKMLPLLKEFNTIKEQEINKAKEKNEIDKICKSSCQTLGFLSNYYKNLRKKINDLSLK